MGAPRGNRNSKWKPIEWVEESHPRYSHLSPCWNCVSHSLAAKGYPRLVRNRRSSNMSHWLYEELFGFIDQGLLVRHRCDNSACINPEHLELGTTADNSADMTMRGRSTAGERDSQAKLKNAQVLEIKHLLASGLTHNMIAQNFGVSRSTISKISRNERWRSLCV